MGSRGWIKLHRKIQDHWIYQEKRQFSRYEAWLDLIMLANHRDNKSLIDGELITVKKGSFITSKRQLCGRWNWSNTKVDNFLKLLEEDGMVTHKSDTKKTVITIAKYEVYHELENEKRHESETETKQKHNGNETETDKQELKELKNLRTKELKDINNNDDGQQVLGNDQKTTNPFTFYEMNFEPFIPPAIINKINDWLEDFSEEMLILAMEKSLEQGSDKARWAYVNRILVNWHKKKLRTPEDVKRDDEKFHAKNNNRFNDQPRQKEVIPEWFNKRNEKPKEASPGQSKQEEQELAELIQKMSRSVPDDQTSNGA